MLVPVQWRERNPMNKTLRKILKFAFWYCVFDAVLLGYAGFVPGMDLAAAQTILVNTTLSSAVQGVGSVNGATPTGNLSIVAVASATGISAPAPNTSLTSGLAATSEAQSYLYVDRELMQVKAVSGTTITVVRGVNGTSGVSHASGALVFVIPGAAFGAWSGNGFEAASQGPSAPQGSCTRANETYLPRIHVSSGTISDCDGGQWVNGDAAQTTRSGIVGSTSGANGFRYPDPGGTALTALETSGTAAAASTEIYCTEIDIPFSMLVTGIAPLNGTTVGTNKHFAILYDAAGAVLGNTATAGTTTAGASTYQKMNLVTPYYLVGPARYFACDGLNGTTDTIRHAVTATNDNILGGTKTGQTFGTAAAITVPSTFTTAKVPYFMLF
jgi:hypothetical protein